MLNKIKSNKWVDEKGNYIWRDDFGTFIISVNNTVECAKTFDKAVAIYNKFLNK